LNQKSLLEDIKNLGGLVTIAVVIVQVFFSKTNILITARLVISLVWISLIPGYGLLLTWRERLTFLEYSVLAAFVGASVTGILSYHLGLIGVNLSSQPILLPLILLMIGIAIEWKVKKHETANPSHR